MDSEIRKRMRKIDTALNIPWTFNMRSKPVSSAFIYSIYTRKNFTKYQTSRGTSEYLRCRVTLIEGA